MPDEPFKISGYDDSTPAKLTAQRAPEDLPHIETERQYDARGVADRLDADARLRNDDVVNKRLQLLKAHIEQLHGKSATLEIKIAGVETKVDAVDSKAVKLEQGMAKNNEMTEKILAAVQGGKFLVGAIKFLGGLAIPVAAL